MKKIKSYPNYNELFIYERMRGFNGKCTEVAFPLGGIGTGNISIGARGQFRDWEIFNRPGKGKDLPFSFFAIRCEDKKGNIVSKILESKIQPPYNFPLGLPSHNASGIPRFEKTNFIGEYPLATINFKDPKIPLDISLEAFTPFIPLNPDDSGIPVAILKYNIKNTSSENLVISLVGSLFNAVGYAGEEQNKHIAANDQISPFLGQNMNKKLKEATFSGILFSSKKYNPEQLRYGEMALGIINNKNKVTYKTSWLRAEDSWWIGFQDFWDDFSKDGVLEDIVYEKPTKDGMSDIGSVSTKFELAPQENKTVVFLLSWYFPNRPYSWNQRVFDINKNEEIIKNYYASRFSGVKEVIKYVTNNYNYLEEKTLQFHKVFFNSTLPNYILDAVSSQISVIRSTTCLWLSDGSFLSYEGCYNDHGCCEGTCTHVWNYAQTAAYLFPSLERNMRQINFLKSTKENGKMYFRTALPFGTVLKRKKRDLRPAADGQMGTIMRLYREWKICGDLNFLIKLWPQAKKSLNFAIQRWDKNDDEIMENAQHNTYDIQFFGPNSLIWSWYLGALKAGIEMAKAIEDVETLNKWEGRYKRVKKKIANLWNGEYYIQVHEDINKYKYQYGKGCLSDQIVGQWLASLLGLGYFIPKNKVKKALNSIFYYNFMATLGEHHNCQRTYALNDESGLLLCTWPYGGRPKFPFPYSYEVWTGIEYQVASHLIYEGFLKEGLIIVKSVRDRYDGIKRNPWNEFECGNHYIRAMASWGVYMALCGLDVDLREKKDDINYNKYGFKVNPKINKNNFSCFWITGEKWGEYKKYKHATNGTINEKIKIYYEKK